MPDVEPPSGVTAAVGRWCPAVARATSRFTTIRGRILIAFLIMSVITGILGGYATMGIRRAGVLVDKTFDESLMSINYARAAAADFSAMQAAFARRMTGSRVDAREADQNIETLQQSLADDLEIAGARSQSSRAANAAAKVQKAARAWTDVYHRMLQGAANDVDWDELDRYASIVDQQIDLLVNYTAGDAFLYRQRARAAGRSGHPTQYRRHGSCRAPLGPRGLVACPPHHRPGGGRIGGGRPNCRWSVGRRNSAGKRG
jgi:hypothetical protein